MRGKRKKKFLGVFRLNDGNVSVDKTERVHTSPLVTAIKTIYNITFILLRLECAIFLECERRVQIVCLKLITSHFFVLIFHDYKLP